LALSATVGRPVVFRCAADDTTQRVVLDLSASDAYTAAYIGDYIDEYDAYPVDFVLVDRVDITGTRLGGGWHIQSSSFNAVLNSRIHDTGTVSLDGAGGVLINGNEVRPARYNVIMGNQIYNTPYEGIYVGAGDHPQENNHTHFNHLIGNRIDTRGDVPTALLENAIDVKEYNTANVIERNVIGPCDLATVYNGAVSVMPQAHHTLVYGNRFQDVRAGAVADVHFVVGLEGQATGVQVFNNVLYLPNGDADRLFGIFVKGDGMIESLVAHNTIAGPGGGLLLADSGITDVTVAANIIACDQPLEDWSTGAFDLSHNLYTIAPSSYASEPGRQVGEPHFADAAAGDLRLTEASGLAIDRACAVSPVVTRDAACQPRGVLTDIGAYEWVVATSVPEDPTPQPGALVRSVFPNPFNPRTTIVLALPRSEPVRLAIHDLAGRRVRLLVDATLAAGEHRIVWDGTDDRGVRLASGVYLCVLASVSAERGRTLVMVR
ncbi:hypothetical protein GF314_13910, partial [bacterium]|nr:hypothetical protein [bacterium]